MNDDIAANAQVAPQRPDLLSSDFLSPADELPALQALIERQAERIDQLNRQIKTHRESMKGILENDTALSEAEVQAETITKAVKERKKSLTDAPEFRELRAKTAELRDEAKELEESLNTHLLSYYDKTKVKTIDLPTGEREFKIRAKLIPKKQEKNL